MKKISLTPKDIPPGSCLRYPVIKDQWFSITRIDENLVFIPYDEHTYQELSDAEFEIYHPIVYPNWKKCYKIEHLNPIFPKSDPIIEHPDA